MAVEYRYQVVNKPPGHISMAPLTVEKFDYEMIPWCNSNLTNYWCWNDWQEYTFWFEDEEDMVKFILQWL